MKRIVFILALSLLSCAVQKAEDVAKSYLGALSSLQFEEASKYVSDNAKSNFAFIRNLYSGLNPQEQKKFQVQNWNITRVQSDDKTATVEFAFDQSQKGVLHLVLENGSWKIQLPKPTP